MVSYCGTRKGSPNHMALLGMSFGQHLIEFHLGPHLRLRPIYDVGVVEHGLKHLAGAAQVPECNAHAMHAIRCVQLVKQIRSGTCCSQPTGQVYMLQSDIGDLLHEEAPEYSS